MMIVRASTAHEQAKHGRDQPSSAVYGTLTPRACLQLATLRRAETFPQTAELAPGPQRRGGTRGHPGHGLDVGVENALAGNSRDRHSDSEPAGEAVAVGVEDERPDREDDRDPPDRVFEQRWAFSVLDAALARLRAECAAARRDRLFDRLQFCLSAPVSMSPSLRTEWAISSGCLSTVRRPGS